MPGGDLHWIWKPYERVPDPYQRPLSPSDLGSLHYRLYGEIDHLYGPPGFSSNTGFTSAQAIMGIIESTLNLEYIYLAHFSQNKRCRRRGEKRADPKAPLIGFAAGVMTLSKTMLFCLQGPSVREAGVVGSSGIVS